MSLLPSHSHEFRKPTDGEPREPGWALTRDKLVSVTFPKTLRSCVCPLIFSKSCQCLGFNIVGRGFGQKVGKENWGCEVKKSYGILNLPGSSIRKPPIKRNELMSKRKTTNSSQNYFIDLKERSPPQIVLWGQYFPLTKGIPTTDQYFWWIYMKN